MSEIPQNERFGPRIGLLVPDEATGQLKTYPWLGTAAGEARVVDPTQVSRYPVTPTINDVAAGTLLADTNTGTIQGLMVVVNPPDDIEAAERLANGTFGAEFVMPGGPFKHSVASDGAEGEITSVYAIPVNAGGSGAAGIVTGSTVKNVNGQLATTVGAVAEKNCTPDQLLAGNYMLVWRFPSSAAVRDISIHLGPTFDAGTQAYIYAKGRSYSIKTGDATANPSHPIAFFRFNEGSGDVISDAFGNVADITLNTVDGSSTATLSDTLGWLTPVDDGTCCKTSVADSYMESLLDPGANDQIIIAMNWYYANLIADGEGVIGIGDVSAGNVGYTIIFGTAENFNVNNRGVGASTQGGGSIGGSSISGYAGGDELTLVFDIQMVGDNFNVNAYIGDSTGVQVLGSLAGDWGAGGSRPAAGGYTSNNVLLFGRAQGAGGDKPLGDAASGVRLDNLLITSRQRIDTTLAAAIATDMNTYKGRIPRSAL